MMGKIMGFLGLQDEEIIEEGFGSEEDLSPYRRGKNNNNNKNIVSLHTQKNVKVVLHEPRSYEETQEIADHLRSRRPVIVNLHQLNPDPARRVVDFLSGCVYALNGDIKKIGPSIFLCTPENVDIHGAITEIIQNEN